MATFDPSKRCIVHDALNDVTIEWVPEKHAANFAEYPGHHDCWKLFITRREDVAERERCHTQVR